MIVALLTCDRYEYTRQTVDSLLTHNDVSGWSLYYADDASTDPRIRPYVESQGFVPLVLHDERSGCSPTTEELVKAVAERHGPDELLLYLQNDFESVRPVPDNDVFQELANDDVSFVQLAYRPPRNRYNRRLKWYWPDGAAWDFGDVSHGPCVYTDPGGGLGYHPSAARIEAWVQCTAGVRKEPEFRAKSIKLAKRLCRLTAPAMRHIGRQATPGGSYGRRHRRRQRVGKATYNPPSVTDRPVIKRSPRQLGVSICAEVSRRLKPGMKTLECGSGLSTWLFYAMGCNHTALEHEAKFAPPLPGVQICPLVGKPPWYDWEPDGPYDLILIDGPPGGRKGQRDGILRVIDRLVHPNTVILLDDTNRPHDSNVADAIVQRCGMQRQNVTGKHRLDFRKHFAILERQ